MRFIDLMIIVLIVAFFLGLIVREMNKHKRKDSE